jgi:uncharacterized metal-binding protein YceD (DUF177 family)
MKDLVPYDIRLKGLKDGVHFFDFTIENDFLSYFENSPDEKVTADVKLRLEKKPGLMVMEFFLTGNVFAPCDRCLVDINIPLSGAYKLLVKSIEQSEDFENEDVIVLHPETPVWNCANVIYENILLAIPVVKRYDCETEVNPPCDKNMIRMISNGIIHDIPEDEENSPWKVLQQWDDKKNS